MRLARLAPLLLVAACASSKDRPPLEAPNVHFNRALIVAEVAEDKRAEVEGIVANEIQKRRPHVQLIQSVDQFSDFKKVTRDQFLAYLQSHEIDLVVTIKPFAELARAEYASWPKTSKTELGDHVEHIQPTALVGRFGVQVVGWDVATRRPVYAKTSQTLVGSSAGPRGVADFAVTSVTTTTKD